MNKTCLSLAILFLTFGALSSASTCRQALAFGLDVSSSVDSKEYALQMQGLASALTDSAVKSVLLDRPDAPVAIAVFEWSGRFRQTVVADWQLVRSEQDLHAITKLLLARSPVSGTQPTALGAALVFGSRLLAKGPSCWHRTLDISGDGKNNDGFRPRLVKDMPAFASITVNGLVIGTPENPTSEQQKRQIQRLEAYFRAEVIHGPRAFIETASGFADYGRAMRAKLLRELEIPVSRRLVKTGKSSG